MAKEKSIHHLEGHGKVDTLMNHPLAASEMYKKIIAGVIAGEEFSPYPDISVLDFNKLEPLKEDEIATLLKNLFREHDARQNRAVYFGNLMPTSEGIEYINELLNEAIDFYQGYLLRNIPESFIQKWNKDKGGGGKKEGINLRGMADVLNFFENLSLRDTAPAQRQIYCSLLKIAFAINDFKEHEDEIMTANHEFDAFRKEWFFPYFRTKKWKVASTVSDDFDEEPISLSTDPAISPGKDPVNFINTGRLKDPKKTILKIIENPKYGSVSLIKDSSGIRNEVTSLEDGLFLLEYLRVHVYKKQGEVVCDNFFADSADGNINFIADYYEELDPDFYVALYEPLYAERNKAGQKKATGKSGSTFAGIKIKGPLGGQDVETQIYLMNNKNESGLACHGIYVAKAKIRALIRLQGYIPESIIKKRYINEAINQDILDGKKAHYRSQLVSRCGYKGDPDKIPEDIKKNIIDSIFKDLMGEEIHAFVQLAVPERPSSHKIYTTIDHWEKFIRNKEVKGPADKIEKLRAPYRALYPKGTSINIGGIRVSLETYEKLNKPKS